MELHHFSETGKFLLSDKESFEEIIQKDKSSSLSRTRKLVKSVNHENIQDLERKYVTLFNQILS